MTQFPNADMFFAMGAGKHWSEILTPGIGDQNRRSVASGLVRLLMLVKVRIGMIILELVGHVFLEMKVCPSSPVET